MPLLTGPGGHPIPGHPLPGGPPEPARYPPPPRYMPTNRTPELLIELLCAVPTHIGVVIAHDNEKWLSRQDIGGRYRAAGGTKTSRRAPPRARAAPSPGKPRTATAAAGNTIPPA